MKNISCRCYTWTDSLIETYSPQLNPPPAVPLTDHKIDLHAPTIIILFNHSNHGHQHFAADYSDPVPVSDTWNRCPIPVLIPCSASCLFGKLTIAVRQSFGRDLRRHQSIANDNMSCSNVSTIANIVKSHRITIIHLANIYICTTPSSHEAPPSLRDNPFGQLASSKSTSSCYPSDNILI